MITLPTNRSISKIDATCEIHMAACLLKNKLMHYVHHHEANLNVSITRLLNYNNAIIIYLDNIATIQWQIYVRKCNKLPHNYMFIYVSSFSFF